MTIIDAKPTFFYYPIKVIFLDDDREFLEKLKEEFSSDINMLTLTNPNSILNEINSYCENNYSSIFKLINNIDVDTTNNRMFNFDVSNHLNLIYNKNRFSQVAVLVVNHEMHDINSFEFCQKIKKFKIFKIMLTADKDVAIKAFNNGLIDRFFLKTSKDLYTELRLAAQELIYNHFREHTMNLINGQDNGLYALFHNELFLQLFSQVASQTQAVEYYMVDSSGGFLFMDKNANPTWLIIRTLEEIMEQIDLLQGYDLPEQLMLAVTKKEKLLFLLTEKDYKKHINQWINYLFDAKKLGDNYFYSIIYDPMRDSIDWDRVSSYSVYQAEERQRILHS